ncbi:MAG: sulfotransferase [Methylophilaceae bacterium]|nr:sulfotransferase [Methylophilaceae bacterium]
MKNIDEELNEVQKNFSKGDYQLALRKINKLIKNNKRNYIVYNYKGIILVALKSSSEAIENFKKALHLNPDFIEAIGNIGMAYHEMSYFEKAIENYKKAYELSGLVQFEINLGNIYLETRKNKEAIYHFNNALKKDSRNEYLHQLLAEAYIRDIKHELAIEHHKIAISINPSNPENYYLLGSDYIWSGNKEMAIKNFIITLNIDHKYYEAYYALSRVHTIKITDNIAKNILELNKISSLPDKNKAFLNFTLAKIYDDKNDISNFTAHITKANSYMKNVSKFNFSKTYELLEKIKYKFSNKSELSNFSCEINNKITPIFILGMPRSGSSLVEQILSNNELIFGAGELSSINESLSESINIKTSDKKYISILENISLDYYDRLSHITDKKYVIDKLPLNFYWIGFIIKMFPHAKIIHTIRNPIAVSYSLYKTLFAEGVLEFSYDQDDIIQYYKLYEDMMHFWKGLYQKEIFELDYELLINNPKQEVKKIFNYLGLKFENSYLDISNNKRSVTTASDIQIRNKINSKGLNSWIKYPKLTEKFSSEFNSIAQR